MTTPLSSTVPRIAREVSVASSRWLPRLLLGTALNAVAWVSAWTENGPLAHYSFFPLWLGFTLVVDALCEMRSGTSLWRRGAAQFVALFWVSAPFWWYFEQLNKRVDNWHYILWKPMGTVEYFLTSSLAFSTVIPAVFAVTELVRTFWHTDDTPHPSPVLPWVVAWRWIGFGVVTLTLSLLFPRQFFPFLWVSLCLILSPINGAYGEASVIAWGRAGAWRAIVRLMSAGLICGFFWEMWNYPSIPKWYYTVPYVGFGKIFEMPVLGYSGYFPFALEVFTVYGFARLLTRRWQFFPDEYVRV